MREVSLSRLYVLRGLYLLIVVGLGLAAVPGIVRHAGQREFAQGIVDCMLLAFWVLCMVGLRHPLLMLPVLLWELVWKVLWLGMFAWPAWRGGTMDANIAANTFACAFVILVPLALPWGYVWRRYVRAAGAPWRAQPGAAAAVPASMAPRP